MKTVLQARGMSVQFGGLKAVQSVDLDVYENEILALIGPNGAGKTTFFNLVSGFLTPYAGSVSFMGTDVTGWPAHKVAALGLVRTFQKTNIFADLTVAQSIRVGCALHRKAGLWTILLGGRLLKAEDRETESITRDILQFSGLNDWADYEVKSIPYGKQRMLSIAVALAARPSLLLLDEPATGLNPVETGELVEMVRRIQAERGVSVFLIEHNMSFVASLARRVVVLCQGEKLTEGSPKEVASNPQVIEAYLGRGFHRVSDR